MLKFEQFKLWMLNAIKKKYNCTELQGDFIKIESGPIEAIMSIKDAYKEYKQINNFNFIFNEYLKILDEEFSRGRFKVEYTNVFPIIKGEDFGKGEGLSFVKEHLFLDLYIFYVSDMGQSFRFLLKEDEFDYKKLKTNALQNISKIDIPLVRIDEDMEIYMMYFPVDYAASLILTERFRRLVEKKVGKNYLFAVPSSSSLLIARDNYIYVDVLKHLIKTDSDPNKISDNIYRYANRQYEYADRKNILKIIK